MAYHCTSQLVAYLSLGEGISVLKMVGSNASITVTEGCFMNHFTAYLWGTLDPFSLSFVQECETFHI